MNKITAKYCLQLKQCHIDVFNNPTAYHQITKDHIAIFEQKLESVVKYLQGESDNHFAMQATKCNQIIEIMDFKKFNNDVVMWRRFATIYENWAAEIKDTTIASGPIEFKSKEELHS